MWTPRALMVDVFSAGARTRGICFGHGGRENCFGFGGGDAAWVQSHTIRPVCPRFQLLAVVAFDGVELFANDEKVAFEFARNVAACLKNSCAHYALKQTASFG